MVDISTLGLRWAGIVVFMAITACSSGGPQEGSQLLDVDDQDDQVGQLGYSSDDLSAARSYFSSDSQEPPEPVLPESGRANELLGGCLSYFGFDVRYAGPGGTYTNRNEAQHDSLVAATEACMEAMHERGLVRLGEDVDTMTRRYMAYVEAYECLMEMGISGDPPPSLDAFLDGDRWYPFNDIGVVVSPEGDLTGPAVDCAVP